MLRVVALGMLAGLSAVSCQKIAVVYSPTGVGSAPAEGEDDGCRFAVLTLRPTGAFEELGFVEFDFPGVATPHGPKSVAEVRRLAAGHVCKAGGNALLLWPANDSGMFKKATILKLGSRAAAGPVSRPRARVRAAVVGPRPRAVPFFHDIRLGMTEAELGRVITRYARRGYWKAADISRQRKRSESRAVGGGPVVTQLGPEYLTVKLRSIPWMGKDVRLTGLHSRLELRLEKGKLAKVELTARGFRAPEFTKGRLERYLRALQPGLKTRVARDRFKMKGRSGRFEVEVDYEPRDGRLEVEVEVERE